MCASRQIPMDLECRILHKSDSTNCLTHIGRTLVDVLLRAGCVSMGVHACSSGTLGQLIVGSDRVRLLGSVVKGELVAKIDGEQVCCAGCLAAAFCKVWCFLPGFIEHTKYICNCGEVSTFCHSHKSVNFRLVVFDEPADVKVREHLRNMDASHDWEYAWVSKRGLSSILSEDIAVFAGCVTLVTDLPGRVPGRKCLCSLGSAHST